jgi:DNA-binding NtrC family response regulator
VLQQHQFQAHEALRQSSSSARGPGADIGVFWDVSLEDSMDVHYSLRAVERRGGGSLSFFTFALDNEDIACAARTTACVLFSGIRTAITLAERIHQESGWRWGPFEVINCGAGDAVMDRVLFARLQDDLWPVESELPVLRLLQPGTLFLEEVGRLSPIAQMKLRDLLELASNETRGRRSRRRIMASSSEPLLTRVLEGSFDQTLFYRLNAIHFVV